MDFPFYARIWPMRYNGRTVESLGLPKRGLEKSYSEDARRIFLHADGAREKRLKP
jgi:hypothetical protein